jgi:hypothetical protein
MIEAFHCGHPRGAPHNRNGDLSELSLSTNNYSQASGLVGEAQQVLSKRQKRSKASVPMQPIEASWSLTADLFALLDQAG